MFACEKAVELAPDNGGVKDSRGVARALTGNYKGAIQDFQAFIDDPTTPEELKLKRKEWIGKLKENKNPFTDKVLEELKKE